MTSFDHIFYDYLLSVLDKAETGPIVESGDFDQQFIYEPIKRLIKEYDIGWDKALYVPAVDDLADRLYAAGLKLALETGVYCLDTQRRMIWTRDELEWILNTAPSEVTLGEGRDQTTFTKRYPEEHSRVPTASGAIGIPVTEELFMPVMISIAQERMVDVIDNASLLTTHGRPIRSGSPWEVVACWQEVDLTFEAIKRAGRPGVAVGCAENSASGLGGLATHTRGGFRPTDWHHVGMISELKVPYIDLTKAVQYTRTGVVSHGFYNPILGGYAGGPEGMAVAIVAGLILMRACYGVQTMNTGPSHPMLACNTHPKMLASQSLAFQALSRNTKMLVSSFVRPVGGPGTKDILYEVAALAIASVASGVSYVTGVHSAMGNHALHVSGLESRFLAQAANAAAGLTRLEADEIVIDLVSKYAHRQNEKPIGKPFNEVYDLATIQPTDEWREIYEAVCEELENIYGLKLPNHS
jgi:methylamine---corrinoid protein Co-methyltransferase